MKQYKQILEAINRGIQFALDDFDYNSALETKSKQRNIDKEDSLWKSIKFKDYFVDLGLPSGTLWAKYNLGANYDILINHPKDAMPEDWEGDYYAWGELEPKIDATKYKFKQIVHKSYGFDDHYIKYNAEDKIMQLELCDDPAYNNNPYKEKLGINICLPTGEQCEELIKYTKPFYYYGIYAPNLFTCTLKSIINDNEIVFPLCGYMSNFNKETIEKTNPEYGYYMSSYIVPEHFDWLSYALQIDKNRAHFDTILREHGVNVRPVLMK